MTPGWRYEFTGPARRDLKRLDPQVQRRVLAAIKRTAASNLEQGDLRRLGRDRQWRLRVGDWRVRFERNDSARMISVVRILPRGRAYER